MSPHALDAFLAVPFLAGVVPFLAAGAVGAAPFLGGIAAGWILSGALIAWRRIVGVGVAALMGAGVSLYLGFQHSPAAGTSLCSVSSTFDCDVVNRSQFSEIGGVPIAFLGTLFYVGLVGLAIWSEQKPSSHRRAAHLMLAGSGLAVLYSAFLAWASVQLGAWCLFCISLYGVNLLLLVGSALMVRASQVSIGDGIRELLSAREERSFGTFLTAGLTAFVVCMFVYSRMGAPPPMETGGDLTKLYEQTRGPMDLDGTEPVLGDPQAPYTVVEFADFQCPACAALTPEMKELVHSRSDIKLLFKHYPISGICNDHVQGDRHTQACLAAASAECARKQGRFWELNKLFFVNQAYLEKDDIKAMAQQVGMDTAAMDACMSDPATEQAVREDVAAAQKVGVNATPSFFLKGLRGDEWVAIKAGPEAIALLIEAKEQGTEIPPPPAPSDDY